MKTKLHIRHGDVFIFKLNKKISSKGFKKEKTLTLALGEVTGHSHKLSSIEGDILVDVMEENSSYLFELTNDSILTHEEHEPITLKPGQYISLIQTEYDPIDHRKKVLD